MPLFLLVAAGHSHAARYGASISKADSLPARLKGYDSLASSARTDRLYDSIAARYTRSGGLQKFVYNSIFVSREADAPVIEKAIDESEIFAPFTGRTISHINVVSGGLMSSDSTWLERTASSIHSTTREIAIRRDLLIREGQALDPELITKSSRNLQSRSYIADVETFVEPDSLNPGSVIVTVVTKDRWSIGLDAKIGNGSRTMLKLYDANVLGYGSRFSVSTNFSLSKRLYGGTNLELNVPNLFGSFFNADLRAGKDFDNEVYGFDVKKDFLLTTDYAAGASLFDNAESTYMLYADSSFRIRSRTGDVWAGRSRYVDRIRSSAYATARFTGSSFAARPPVGPSLNPAYHDNRMVLLAAGLYRERFLSANMIYGYGYREYLAAGYRAELVGGYYAGEFGDDWYAGGSYRLGGFGSLGYLMGGVGLGMFIPDADGRRVRGALMLESQYFTNLLRMGRRSHLRQFVTFSCLQGWNRYRGSDEVISFHAGHSLRAMDEYTVGVNRSRLSLETVFFTPYQPWGFRIAVFGYTDMGLIGFRANQFDNPFYATVGAGIRIRNERLVFNAVEIRLGVAVGKNGWLPSRYVDISNQGHVEQIRFTPEKPKTIIYK